MSELTESGNAASFATVDDVLVLFRTLTPEEQTKTEALLPIVSELLRQAAKNVGQDLDRNIADGTLSADVARVVTVDVIARVLRQSTTGEPVSQISQSGFGYSANATYAIPGGGIAAAIMNNDLKRLGLTRRQKIRVIDMMEGSRE